MSNNENVKDTISLAEKALNSIADKRKPQVLLRSGSDGSIKFRQTNCFGTRNLVDMDYSVNITDDSGFIPLEKEVERFQLSGRHYEQYMRMAFPNGSADKVADDYVIDNGCMSRLDAINYVKSQSLALQDRIFSRVRDERAREENAPISANVGNAPTSANVDSDVLKADGGSGTEPPKA